MDFTLEKADSQEFARWWAVYRNVNEDFSQGFAEQYSEIEHVPYCHWILLDGQRVGGMIMVSNNVGDFFLIPPFQDAYRALKAILPSDTPLHARNMLSDHVRAFQRLGFQIEESRCWMLRPTQAVDVAFELPPVPVDVAHTDALAELMLAAFQGGAGGYGQRDVGAHRQSVENYFESVSPDDVCYQASSVVFDGDQMVAACLVQPYKSLASIRFVVTHPDYQQRGIARRLIQYSMNAIHDQYAYVTLAVTVGNPAEGLYDSMGFVAGAVTHTLLRG